MSVLFSTKSERIPVIWKGILGRIETDVDLAHGLPPALIIRADGRIDNTARPWRIYACAGRSLILVRWIYASRCPFVYKRTLQAAGSPQLYNVLS